MIPAVKLLAAAEEDLAAAREWYRQCHLHLEADLLACVEDAVNRIARHPLASPESRESIDRP
jgi:hypothetical protein